MNAYDTIFLFPSALESFVTKSLESYMLELWGKVVIKAHVCPTLSLCAGIAEVYPAVLDAR